jgi:hypothetical protein
MTACTLWMEINRLRAGQKDGAGIGVIESSRSRLILLWGTVAILNIAIISEVGIAYTKFYADEKARLIRTTEVANDSFAEHTQQLANQVDTILGAVREFYLHTHSLANTDAFIDSMRLDRSFFLGMPRRAIERWNSHRPLDAERHAFKSQEHFIRRSWLRRRN